MTNHTIKTLKEKFNDSVELSQASTEDLELLLLSVYHLRKKGAKYNSLEARTARKRKSMMSSSKRRAIMSR